MGHISSKCYIKTCCTKWMGGLGAVGAVGSNFKY